MAAELRTVSEHGTLILTLANPEHGNALVPGMCAAGIEVFASVDSNPDVGAIVITGGGTQFCSGLAPHRWPALEPESGATRADALGTLHDWIEAVATCPVPVLAAVEGAAAGAGLALALACDLIVAASNATFGAHDARAASGPNAGVDWFLGRALPRQLASELVLGNAAASAERLYQVGLINRVCEPSEALRAALDWAAALAGTDRAAMARTKERLAQAPEHTLTQHLALEREPLARALQSRSTPTRRA